MLIVDLTLTLLPKLIGLELPVVSTLPPMSTLLTLSELIFIGLDPP